MIVFRATSIQHKDKLDGVGAKTKGGRWNREGLAVNYTSDSKATVRDELRGRVDPKYSDYVWVEIEVSDDLPITKITREMLAGLPWDMDVYDSDDCPSQKIGSEILESNEIAILQVPSARSEGDNYLLNPNYPDFDKYVKIVSDDKPFDWED